MGKRYDIGWFEQPEEHNYPAAESYLNLLFEDKVAADLVRRLKKTGMSKFKAKDIFRASGLSLLGVSNHHVERDRAKILQGEKLSPLLLVRDAERSRLVIADGYHRLCSVYQFDEDAWIPCKIV